MLIVVLWQAGRRRECGGGESEGVYGAMCHVYVPRVEMCEGACSSRVVSAPLSPLVTWHVEGKLDAARLPVSILSHSGTADALLCACIHACACSTATVVCEEPKRPEAAKAFGSRLAISKTLRGLCDESKSATLGKDRRVDIASPLGPRGDAAVHRAERAALSKLPGRWMWPGRAGKGPCPMLPGGGTPTAAAASCASAVSDASAGTPPIRFATPEPPISISWRSTNAAGSATQPPTSATRCPVRTG